MGLAATAHVRPHCRDRVLDRVVLLQLQKELYFFLNTRALAQQNMLAS